MEVFIGLLIAILLFIIGSQLLKALDHPSYDENGNPVCDNDGNFVYDSVDTGFGILIFIICCLVAIGFVLFAVFSAIF